MTLANREPDQSARPQRPPRARDYRVRFHVCDFCGTADNGVRARHIFTSDDGMQRLCRACIAECVDLIDDFLKEGVAR